MQQFFCKIYLRQKVIGLFDIAVIPLFSQIALIIGRKSRMAEPIRGKFNQPIQNRVKLLPRRGFHLAN